MDREPWTETYGDVRLQISSELSTAATGGDPTMFAPQSSEMTTKNSSTENSVSAKAAAAAVRAPEKKLTLFALRLAVLEKAATGLGTLSFIWATVVLLGGFAIALERTDFWFITVILLIEGARIFSRSRELEWQHQATWSLTDVGIHSFRAIKSSSHFVARAVKVICSPISAVKKASQHGGGEISGNSSPPPRQRRRHWHHKKTLPTRTWTSSEVPLFPYAKWMFTPRNMGKILHWLQIASATTCLVLSLMKLIRQDYGVVGEEDTDKKNRKSALNIFYSLALAEALLFLLEKAYWEWKVFFKNLLEEVNQECELGPAGMVSVKRFFYDAYSKCVYGSIFDGIKMDMVSFAMELLASNSPDEQLSGALILRKFATSPRFSADTLQKIGTNIAVMERLVEMLNWKNDEDEEIRVSAAEILSKLAGKKQNALRVAGIPGAMESISSLLQISRDFGGACDEISEKRIIFDSESYGFWTFNHLGLLILKKLARDHDNCGKIGNTRGLLPKIIDFTQAGERLLRDKSTTPTQILTLKRSLQLVKMLASTTGATGKELRREISEVVFSISNIRDVLRYGENHPSLQCLGIEILKSLALEEEATERIGGTGGVLKELFGIFFKEGLQKDQRHVRIAAGEALGMLALESRNNCHGILRLKVTGKLVAALQDPVLGINAARILRNLCVYSGPDSFEHLGSLTAAGPIILKAIMSEQNKMQEVMLGLAAHVFRFVTPEESSIMFARSKVQESELAQKLVQILGRHQYPSIKVPRIRRFAIELAIWMMRDKTTNTEVFRNLGLEHQLECITETTSELESFNVFSGTVGINRHGATIHSLVETALKLLKDGQS
nr:Armadillo-type fold protein [Ipomoea batatas]